MTDLTHFLYWLTWIGLVLNGFENKYVCSLSWSPLSQPLAPSSKALLMMSPLSCSQASDILPVILETCVPSFEYSYMSKVSEIPREPRALPEALLPFCLQQLLLYHSIMTYMHIKTCGFFLWISRRRAPVVPSLLTCDPASSAHTYLDISNDSPLKA